MKPRLKIAFMHVKGAAYSAGILLLKVNGRGLEYDLDRYKNHPYYEGTEVEREAFRKIVVNNTRIQTLQKLKRQNKEGFSALEI